MLLQTKRKEFKCFFLHLEPAVCRDFNSFFSLFRLIFLWLFHQHHTSFLLSWPFFCQIVVYPTIFLIRMKWNRSFTKRRSKYLNRNRTPESQQKKQHTKLISMRWVVANVRHFLFVRFIFFGDWWNRPRQRPRNN